MLCGCMAASGLLLAQGLPQTSRAAHEARLPQLRALVQQCATDASACKPEKAGPDESFQMQNGLETEVHYAWLRQTLAGMSKQKPEDRGKTAAIVLAKLFGDDDGAVAARVDPAKASAAATEVLSQVEFSESKQSWLSKKWDRFTEWLSNRLNVPAPSHGTRQWLRFLVEAVLFGTPLLLLLLWLLRQAREDRFRTESTGGKAKRTSQATDLPWLEVAQECARRGEWREAVHALYWQTMSTLESRRLLSVSRTRTPRESLRLLEPGSSARPLLREQTMLLEKVWYGQVPATEQDYQRARTLQEEVLRA